MLALLLAGLPGDLAFFCLFLPCSKLYAVGMRQSAAWGLYLVAGTSAHHAALVLSMLLGGSMVYQGFITAEQLTSFMFYVQLVTASSLAVCDQYGAVMEVRAADSCRVKTVQWLYHTLLLA